MRKVSEPRCEVCSQPFFGAMDSFVCGNCQGRRFYFECAVAVMRSRGVMRDLIHRLKYNQELWLAGLMGEILEVGLEDLRMVGVDFAAIVPVPLHRLRKREREFNQAEVVARELGSRTGKVVWDVLCRERYTVTQTHFDRQQRMQNLRDAFSLRQNTDVEGKDLLLVDDVLTTGSTLDECARVLLEGGANSVRALTVARG